ncbi:MAG: SDR family oxidoreductase [Candidatus Hydrogenedentota bacterium]
MTDELPLAGHTALITGGAKRLGRAVTEALAGAGADVCIHYRNSADEAAELAGRLRGQGRQAWTARCDLADSEDVAAFLPRVIKEAGAVDILINNASIFPESTLMDFTAEEFHENVSVNALAPVLLGRAFAKRAQAGHIINFLDTRIVSYDRTHAAYHLSKRTLFTLTRMMALEFAPAIRVNAIAPGLILPPEGKTEAYLEQYAHTNPMQTYGSPEDIADTVLFFLKTGFITGQIIYVDGGRHMKGGTYG